MECFHPHYFVFLIKFIISNILKETRKKYQAELKLITVICRKDTLNAQTKSVTDQSLHRYSKALGSNTKIANQYHQPSPCPAADPTANRSGLCCAVTPSLSNSRVIAHCDHKGHEEGPFTIWGSTALTKAPVSAECTNRRRARLAFCSVVALQLGQSLWQLDLHLWTWSWLWRTERRPCPALTTVTLSVMALITAPGHEGL